MLVDVPSGEEPPPEAMAMEAISFVEEAATGQTVV
jgi:hypothetical protein